MADSDAIRIKGTIALAGGRAFFVPAGSQLMDAAVARVLVVLCRFELSVDEN